ncbi:unnamed protein product, partial [Ectocarpus sp. 12 AP-2014]
RSLRRNAVLSGVPQYHYATSWPRQGVSQHHYLLPAGKAHTPVSPPKNAPGSDLHQADCVKRANKNARPPYWREKHGRSRALYSSLLPASQPSVARRKLRTSLAHNHV